MDKANFEDGLIGYIGNHSRDPIIRIDNQEFLTDFITHKEDCENQVPGRCLDCYGLLYFCPYCGTCEQPNLKSEMRWKSSTGNYICDNCDTLTSLKKDIDCNGQILLPFAK